jgi:hypothetical protein
MTKAVDMLHALGVVAKGVKVYISPGNMLSHKKRN